MLFQTFIERMFEFVQVFSLQIGLPHPVLGCGEGEVRQAGAELRGGSYQLPTLAAVIANRSRAVLNSGLQF